MRAHEHGAWCLRGERLADLWVHIVGLVLAGKDGSISEERLRQLQAPLVAAQTERALAQSRYEVAKTTSIDALPDVITDASLHTLLDKITELKREEAELSPIYTPKHEKIQRIRAQIAPLEAAFAQARAAIVERIKAEYEAAVRREKLLQSEYGSQTSLVSGDSEKMIQYNILKRESDSNRALYDAMLTKVNEAGVSSALQASNVRVVDPARAPTKPYKPDYYSLVGQWKKMDFTVKQESWNQYLGLDKRVA